MWSSFRNVITLQIVSADVPKILDRLACSNIPVNQINLIDEFSVEIQISRADYCRAEALLKKHNCKLTVISRRGIYWQIKAFMTRPVLLLGITLYIFAVITVPAKVYFLRVEGNSNIPVNKILEAAQSSGIYFGANRRDVRSEKVKNALLQKLPELQWAGVNTYGCVAVISVKERLKTDMRDKILPIDSIVAAHDGIIRQITVTKGTQLCEIGKAVKAGEILVSGYKDYGISLRFTGAQASVYAQTERMIVAITPAIAQVRTEMVACERKYSLIIGKKQINFFKDSGIYHTGCVKIYKKTYIVLPGGYTLPVSLVTQEIFQYQTDECQIEDCSFLEDACRSYMQSMVLDGSILTENGYIENNIGVCQFTANYSCYEQIGLAVE